MFDSHPVASISDLGLGQLVLDVAEMICRYHLRIPTDLFMMTKSLVTAEGAVRLIHPEMDLVSEIRPHLQRMAAQRFSLDAAWHGAGAFLFRLAAAPTRFPQRIGDIVKKME